MCGTEADFDNSMNVFAAQMHGHIVFEPDAGQCSLRFTTTRSEAPLPAAAPRCVSLADLILSQDWRILLATLAALRIGYLLQLEKLTLLV
jgi:hypothetical protein